MRPLRAAKLAVLSTIYHSGLNEMVLRSNWRARRLSIVCWHGVSADDEHRWNPYLFMSSDTFKSRLQLLAKMKCNVLPLGEALVRLRDGGLPPRSVAITIDDGESSVYLRSWPMLREFGFPATLYWTTYYSVHPLAVFDPMLQYLLWKGRERTLQLAEPPMQKELHRPADRMEAFTHIYAHAKACGWTGQKKEEFLEHLARSLGVDYGEIRGKRILHLISPDEAKTMLAQGLDLQLHTHRHRTSRRLGDFNRELEDNERVLRAVGCASPTHFCYPSGSFFPQCASWLRTRGIVSATTCEPGLARRSSDAFFLPRFVDHGGLAAAEFCGCISGIAATLTRGHIMDEHGFY